MEIQLVSPVGKESTLFKKFFDDDIIIPKNSKVYLNHAIFTKNEGVVFTETQTLRIVIKKSDVYGFFNASDLEFNIPEGSYTYSQLQTLIEDGIQGIVDSAVNSKSFSAYLSGLINNPLSGDSYIGLISSDEPFYVNDTNFLDSTISINVSENSGIVKQTSASTLSCESFYMNDEPYFHSSYVNNKEYLSDISMMNFDLYKDSTPLTMGDILDETGNDPKIIMGFYGREYADDNSVGAGTRTSSAGIVNVNSTGVVGTGGIKTITIYAPVTGFQTTVTILDSDFISTAETVTLTSATIGGATAEIDVNTGTAVTISLVDVLGDPSPGGFTDGESYTAVGNGKTVTGVITAGAGVITGLTVVDSDTDINLLEGITLTGDTSGVVFQTFILTATGTISDVNIVSPGVNYTQGETISINGNSSGTNQIGTITETNSIDSYPTTFFCASVEKRLDSLGAYSVFLSVFVAEDTTQGETKDWNSQKYSIDSMKLVSRIDLRKAEYLSDDKPLRFKLGSFNAGKSENFKIYPLVYLRTVSGVVSLFSGDNSRSYFNDDFFFGLGENTEIVQLSQIAFHPIFSTNTLDFGSNIYGETILKDDDSFIIKQMKYEATDELAKSLGFYQGGNLEPSSDIISITTPGSTYDGGNNTPTGGSGKGMVLDLTVDSTGKIVWVEVVTQGDSYKVDDVLIPTGGDGLARLTISSNVVSLQVSPSMYPNIGSFLDVTKENMLISDFQDFFRLQSYVIKINNIPIQSWKTNQNKGQRGYKQSILGVIPTPFQNASSDNKVTLEGQNYISATFNSYYPLIKNMNNQRIVLNHFEIEVSRLSDDQRALDLDQVSINFTIVPGEEEE